MFVHFAIPKVTVTIAKLDFKRLGWHKLTPAEANLLAYLVEQAVMSQSDTFEIHGPLPAVIDDSQFSASLASLQNLKLIKFVSSVTSRDNQGSDFVVSDVVRKDREEKRTAETCKQVAVVTNMRQAENENNSDNGSTSVISAQEISTQNDVSAQNKGRSEEEAKTPTSRIWNAYADAYEKQYGIFPKKNARTMGQCKHLLQRLGEEEAILVVRFYLTHKKSWYVSQTHSLGACLKDAEGLRTQMLTGHKVSSAEAQQADKQSANQNTFERVAAKLKAEGYFSK